MRRTAYGVAYDAGSAAATLDALGIDPDTDLDTHVLVAVPKCETCGGTGETWYEPTPETCPDCDGRGWRMT